MHTYSETTLYRLECRIWYMEADMPHSLFDLLLLFFGSSGHPSEPAFACLLHLLGRFLRRVI